MAGARNHWQDVYAAKAPEQTSWFRPRLDESLRLALAHAPDRDAPVIDVGGGRATFVDDLLAQGYGDVTVLDVAGEALEQARIRLASSDDDAVATAFERGAAQFLETDLLDAALPAARYGLWHDRAVFHFLVDASEQEAYVALAARSLRPGGVAILATFAPDGPARCSGLPVQRYDADALAACFGDGFERVVDARDLHATPFGSTQPFTYVVLRRRAGDAAATAAPPVSAGA
jgi:SAM-dependent methyltransferase